MSPSPAGRVSHPAGPVSPRGLGAFEESTPGHLRSGQDLHEELRCGGRHTRQSFPRGLLQHFEQDLVVDLHEVEVVGER